MTYLSVVEGTTAVLLDSVPVDSGLGCDVDGADAPGSPIIPPGVTSALELSLSLGFEGLLSTLPEVPAAGSVGDAPIPGTPGARENCSGQEMCPKTPVDLYPCWKR